MAVGMCSKYYLYIAIKHNMSLVYSECVCDPHGTQQSSSDPALLLCNQTTGLCECNDNVGGDMCNICDVSYE